VMLTLGTGVGGGVISGGRVVRGAIGAAGHLGHYTIDPDGLPCICGNRGCVETVFSSKAIEAAAFSALHRGVATSLAGSPTCHEVFVAAEAGDAVASHIITHAITALAGALAGLCFIFDPDLIVIGGQIAGAGEFLLGPLRSQVWQRTVPLVRREIPIVRTTLADPSGVLGAAALAMQH
jgi:glucokinase